MKPVFVTGAGGFTGSYLCKGLIKKGYQVTALVRKEKDIPKLESQGIQCVIGDLSDPDSLRGKLAGMEIVFHIAALYRTEGVSKNMFFKVNVEGTRALLDEAISAGVKRFVHCSTVGVQGEIADPPATEEAPYNPGDHYQDSKLEGEKLALSYFEQGKIDGVVVRPVGIYGPGDTRFLKLFRHIYKGNFKMIGKGQALYHLTFVEDLCAGIILAGEVPDASGQIYTIGGNEYLPLTDLVNLLAEILEKPVSKLKIPLFPVYVAAMMCELICRPFGIEPPLYRRRLDFFTKDRAFDISKAKDQLGYKPVVPLKEGLAITAQWYKEKGMLD
jgi:nucleoside-diphosphate-sugar epimerase